MTEEQEVFIPTFELVLCNRDHQGRVVDKKTKYTATSGQDLAGCLAKHNKKFPRPKRKKAKKPTQERG